MELIIIIIVVCCCCCCISLSASSLYFFSQSSSLSPTMTEKPPTMTEKPYIMTEKPYIMTTEPPTMTTKPPIVIPTPTLSNEEKRDKSNDLIKELNTKVGSNFILVEDIINEIKSLESYSIDVIPAGSMVTMDYRENRLRVFIENGIFKGVKKG